MCVIINISVYSVMLFSYGILNHWFYPKLFMYFMKAAVYIFIYVLKLAQGYDSSLI